jgi:hypothetical protein
VKEITEFDCVLGLQQATLEFTKTLPKFLVRPNASDKSKQYLGCSPSFD